MQPTSGPSGSDQTFEETDKHTVARSQTHGSLHPTEADDFGCGDAQSSWKE